MALPFGIYAYLDPASFTSRFSQVSSLTLRNLFNPSYIDNILANYSLHFSPQFLLFSGDANLRHATGYTGQLYLTVYFLAVIGLASLLSPQSRIPKAFSLWMILGLVISPVAAALTEFGLPHATRSILLAYYFLFFSALGLNFLLIICSQKFRPIIAFLVCVLTLTQAGPYLNHYFTNYAQASASAFESYNLPQLLSLAYTLSPNQVILDSDNGNAANKPYIQHLFYNETIPNPKNIPFILAPATATKNTCVIMTPWKQAILPSSKTTFHDFTIPGSFMHLYCYF